MKPRSSRLGNLLAAVIILACLSILAGLVTREARWRNWLKASGCHALPMQNADTTNGMASGELCWECAGKVTVCR